ncbi:ABC transporter permease [Patescibacteria group bacterium]|nr:ABC transporter permease [Patescibacteria group bacterium]
MKNIITIWKKELKDTIRDRRTLMAMIILPMFLMPLIIIGMGWFIEAQVEKAEEQIVQVAVENIDAAPAFMQVMDQHEKITTVDFNGNIQEAVKNDEYLAGIIIPDNFNQLIETQGKIEIVIVRNSINTDSSTAVSRIAEGVTSYNNLVLAGRFSEQGIEASILNSVVIQPEDVATEKEVGGFGLGFLLPLFIILWSVIGGQYTAVDVSAGEKERKTLESLLLTPVKRLDIVFGKFLAVSTTALISVVVALSSLYAAISIFGFGDFGAGTGVSGELNFSIDLNAVLIMFGISILLVLMFSAMQLSISIFAKSYKEAQSYIGPSYLVVILPTVLVNTLPNFKPETWFFAIPVVNAIMLFKEVLIGVYDVSHIITTIVSLLICSIIVIFIATKIYSKEGILFRD